MDMMVCRSCRSEVSRQAYTLEGCHVLECVDCGFCWCQPLPRVESESANEGALLSDESFTRDIIERFPSTQHRYHRLARNRHKLFRQQLGKEQYRILEIGCGVAGAAEAYTRLGATYKGIDIDRRVIAAAQSRGVDVEQVDYYDYEPDTAFDVITTSQVLEHIVDPARVRGQSRQRSCPRRRRLVRRTEPSVTLRRGFTTC